MAKALLDAALSAAGYSGVVDARALHVPAPAVAQEAVDALQARGLDVSDHVPRQVTDEEIHAADLVLLMEKEHLATASARWPEHASKMFRMMDWATGEPSDIKDPIGDPDAYEVAAMRLEKAVKGIVARLQSQSQGN